MRRPALRLRGRLPARPSQVALWTATAVAPVAVLALLMIPAGPRATRLVSSISMVARTITRRAPAAPSTLRHGKLFGGVREVGALFTYANGALGSHFCSASVVDSRVKDLVVTAAHCVSKLSAGNIVYIPEWNRTRPRQDPYGIWSVSKIVVDSAWQTSGDPNDDVAFLVVQQANNASPIQDVTGGERLAFGWGRKIFVHVIGYPDGRWRPIICANRTRKPQLPAKYAYLDKTQLEFDCGGYLDGTSGGPFLADYNAKTGHGTLIGVIGGYEEGGDIASVSYSARFGSTIRALYHTAVSEG